MKKFTKFSLAAVAVLGLSSEAYAASAIQIGATGAVIPLGTNDAITMNVTGTNPLTGYTAGANTLNIFALDVSGGLPSYVTDPYTVNIYATGGTNISGGDLYMNDNQIHGLAPGTLGTDAVNLNQLNAVENDMSGGIAAVTAIANIPQVDQGKTYSLGIGFGHYSGENAFAVGGSWRYNTDGILKASIGSGGSGATVGVGTAMSW